MTLGEQLRAQGKNEGIMEGIIKGKIQIAKRLLSEKVEMAFIQRVTGLPLAKLEEIQQKH